MVANPFVPQQFVGRQAELQQVGQILADDGDLLIAGVPGVGRRTLVHWAARQQGAKVIEIDCLRAIDGNRFLKLLAAGLVAAFGTPGELALIQRWSTEQPLILEQPAAGLARLVWYGDSNGEWEVFRALLSLPQTMAEWLDCRVVLVFQNFPHIRSWDRTGKWEHDLRHEIQQQSRVSYTLIATVAERWVEHSNLQVMTLAPLPNPDMQAWIVPAMATEGLEFESSGQALNLFLQYVQGHFGDAIALARRIWMDQRVTGALSEGGSKLSTAVIQAHHVHRSALALVEDLAMTFESLILLLPPSQVRVLESLALDPTPSPHARDYIRKHNLSRGGGLQGALASLEQKGLVYGAELGYQITLPMLAFWLRHRLA